MSSLELSGETTTSTGDTKSLFYNRQEAKPSRKKIIELPTFKVQTMENAFKDIAPTVKNQKNIFGDLIAEGDLCILFGRAGTGKSFLGYQIAGAIAEGKNVLDMLDIMVDRSTRKYHNLNNETPAQKVLYADFEATIEKTYRRYNPYTFSENFLIAIPDRLTVVDNLLFIDSIEAEIIKTGAKVLIIDNISAISQDNEKSNQAAK
jgi:DNA repair protein RadA/Sms